MFASKIQMSEIFCIAHAHRREAEGASDDPCRPRPLAHRVPPRPPRAAVAVGKRPETRTLMLLCVRGGLRPRGARRPSRSGSEPELVGPDSLLAGVAHAAGGQGCAGADAGGGALLREVAESVKALAAAVGEVRAVALETRARVDAALSAPGAAGVAGAGEAGGAVAEARRRIEEGGVGSRAPHGAREAAALASASVSPAEDRAAAHLVPPSLGSASAARARRPRSPGDAVPFVLQWRDVEMDEGEGAGAGPVDGARARGRSAERAEEGATPPLRFRRSTPPRRSGAGD